ncbi:hypothetical protein [Aeromonas caviae]|uniref:hypothetical protein n=1 Tax=Aeromonas caviae TaxID=648 RepID=UPI0022038867|nr:hypothetical protein [Aeromonas caviae]BDS29362.1 hypothetical protein KAM479c_10860 [Aeromonas caviae]
MIVTMLGVTWKIRSWKTGKVPFRPLFVYKSQALEITRRATKDETRKGLGTLNQMLDYAVVHCLIEANPARLLRPKDFGASAGSPRERWLTVPELRRLWKAIDEDLGSGGSFSAGGRGISRHMYRIFSYNQLK